MNQSRLLFTLQESITCTASSSIDSAVYFGTRNGSIIVFKDDHLSMKWHGHDGTVSCLVYSVQNIVSAGHDGRICLWSDGDCVRTLETRSVHVMALHWSQTGLLLSGGSDKLLSAWDIQSGSLICSLKGSKGWILSIASTKSRPDSVYTADTAGEIICWDLASHCMLSTVSAHQDWIYSLQISRDTIYTSSKDGCIKAWDLDTQKHISTLQNDMSPALSLVLLNSQLYASCEDGHLQTWNTHSSQKTVLNRGKCHTFLCVSGSKLVSAGADGVVRMYDLTRIQGNTNDLHPDDASVSLSAAFKRDSAVASASDRTSRSSADSSSVSRRDKISLQLKAEIAGLKNELYRVRAESRSLIKRASKAELLEKELLETRKQMDRVQSQLQATQSAHRDAASYVCDYAELRLVESERELDAFWTLFDSRIGLFHHDIAADHMQTDCRIWELDPNWDTNEDVQEELAWWRTCGPDKQSSDYFYFPNDTDHLSPPISQFLEDPIMNRKPQPLPRKSTVPKSPSNSADWLSPLKSVIGQLGEYIPQPSVSPNTSFRDIKRSVERLASNHQMKQNPPVYAPPPSNYTSKQF